MTDLDSATNFLWPLLLAILIVCLFYWYSIQNHDYWKVRGVPYIKPVPFVGSIFQNMKSPLQDLDLKRHIEIGPIYGHFEGNKPILTIADPKLLRQIMLKDFQYFSGKRKFSTGDEIADKMLSFLQGEDWRRVRSVVSKTFSTGKIKRMFRIFKECSAVLVDNFTAASKTERPVDIKSFYGGFTLDNIASSAFSTKLNSHNDPENGFVKTARQLFSDKLSWRFMMFLLCPRLMRALKISLFEPSIMMFFKELTLEIVKQRKASNDKRGDFLEILLEAVEGDVEEENRIQEDNDNAGSTSENDFKHTDLRSHSIQRMSMDELVSMCVSFFLGGYNTTVTTLSFASYLLALHGRVQDKARDEIRTVLAAHEGVLSYETLQEMQYLDNIISETLRLYPPGFRLDRVSDTDYKLGETGIIIPNGMLVVIPIYALQRDPNFYENPDEFDPSRFSKENVGKRDPFSYLPFGAGPRYCIGMRFALLEMKVCLAHVLSSFHIKTCPQTTIPIEWVNQGFSGQKVLHPKDIFLMMEMIEEGFIPK